MTKESSKDKLEGRKSLEYFAITYFPHIFTIKMSVFHHEMFADAQLMIENSELYHQQQFFVRAAPRSFGKSRIISVVLPIWCIVYNLRKNICLIADSLDQSKEYIATIKTEFEENDKLKSDFGNLIGSDKWSEDEIITGNNVRVIAKSTGKKLRGSSYNNVRPDLLILDDLENDEMIETEGQRNKLKKWFTKVLMPIGMPWSCFLYVGSVLHYDSLLYMVLRHRNYSNWNRKIYKAIYQFSNSPLWGQWEEIFTDLSNPNASIEAKEFYHKNKQEMLEGTVLLWPEWHSDVDGSSLSYYDLMISKLQDDESFNSEYQNDPQTEESRMFKEAWIKSNYYDETPQLKSIYGSVDLSMGKSRTADTSAITFIGQGVDNYIYILESDIARRSPDKIMSDIIEYIVKYNTSLTGFVVETNVFQEFFATTLKKMCLDMELYVNWIERKSVAGESKMLRIKSLAPKIKLGYIKFNPEHRELITQLKDFPKGHDDGPDSLEMCIAQVSNASAGVLITSLNRNKSKKMNEKTLMKGWGRRWA